MLSAVALAFGLAMDATAVCAARALGAGAKRELAVLPLLFGLFQAGMAALGWLGGRWASAYIAKWDHWVAGGLLVLIGAHMIVEAWKPDHEREDNPGSALLYLGLAVATSIDAAAAGLTLPLYSQDGGPAPWLVLTVIGGVTSACCALGYAAARMLGKRVGPRLGIFGGLVLIAIAVNMFVRQP